MKIINAVNSEKSTQYKTLSRLLKTHYLNISKPDIKFGTKNPKKISTLLKNSDSNNNVLFVRQDQLYCFKKSGYTIYDEDRLEHNISNYLIENHQHTEYDLSCRNSDLHLLQGMLKNGSPDFSKSPDEWVRKSPFFDMLRPRPFYDRLLAYNLDQRGMFLKVWKYRAQRNYFHPSVNSGLPLLKKDDPVHEGTFMMHDMFHHIFLDPIITGHETKEERAVYIACRMMSEACTLVLADMVAVAHSGIEEKGYDVTKRKIYPLFKSLKLDAFDIETVRKVMYANCVYVLFGDTTVYHEMKCDLDALKEYTGKYENFFSGDFKWNDQNINNVLREMNSYSGLKKYFACLDDDYKQFNTRTLTNNIRRKDGNLSFNLLFEEFWKQLKNLIFYENKTNKIAYAKFGYLKYISGQIYIAFKYNNTMESRKIIKGYRIFINEFKKLKKYEDICLSGTNFVNKINSFIDSLYNKKVITGIESEMYKLHVPHFPPIYLNYDKDNFEPLVKVSKEILGNYFEKESFKYKKMNAKIRNHYFKIVSGI